MDEMKWARRTAEKILKKERAVVLRCGDKIPYTTKDGVFNDCTEDICWWTNGFWGGILWQLYHAAGEELYREKAVRLEEKLDRNLMTAGGMDHDSGFRWLPTAVAHWRTDQNPESLNRGLLAANDLAGRFNPAGRFIRAWNDGGDGSRAGWAIIDCMMNLPLLYWAWERLRDPRYLQIATMHADTAMKYFIREDGSANHIVCFDPATGEFLQSLGGQGYGTGSSWTRGQAWALYGFTLSYVHTKEERYLNTARRAANYFIANIPENGRIPVDFRQPADVATEDSTAAAIAASGLLKLSEQLTGRDAAVYRSAALRLLRVLDEERCCWDTDVDHLLEKCTAAYHDREHEFAIIYGDYYFIEAVFRLTGQEMFIW